MPALVVPVIVIRPFVVSILRKRLPVKAGVRFRIPMTFNPFPTSPKTPNVFPMTINISVKIDRQQVPVIVYVQDRCAITVNRN